MPALIRALVGLVLLSAVAAAQPSSESTKLFEEGRELARQQNWAEACERFRKSLALDPAPGTKLNLGECLEKQGRVRAGWLMYVEAGRDFEQLGDSRAKFAHDRAAAAAAKLATLVIRLPQASLPGLTVRVGDRDATPSPEMIERVDPGDFFVSVAAPDKQVFVGGVVAVAGETVTLVVPELADAVPSSPAASPRPQPEDNGRRGRVMLAIGLGAGGVVALAASGYLGLSARSQYDRAFDSGECAKTPDGNFCSPRGLSEIEDAGSRADLATGFAIAGVALAAAGVIVYVTAPEEGVVVAPVATSSSAGLVLGGTF